MPHVPCQSRPDACWNALQEGLPAAAQTGDQASSSQEQQLHHEEATIGEEADRVHFEQLTMQRSIWRMPPQAVIATKLAATRQRAALQVRAADIDPEQLGRRGLDKGYGMPSTCRQHNYPYLNTTPVLWGLNTKEGVVVTELFGGIGAGVEACAANGIPIAYVLYSDTNPVAKTAMWNRLEQLHATYPLLLPRSAYREVFKLLPDDVCNITTHDLEALVALAAGRQIAVFAGWPCQDFSPGGKGMGMEGKHGPTFRALITIISELQRLQPKRPPLYFIENGPMKFTFEGRNPNHPVKQAYDLIVSILGEPIITRVVQQTYIAGPYTTYILVYTVYTSRNVYKTYTGFTLYGRGAFAQYTTYIVLYTVYTSRNVCETYTKFKVI